eukprot:scaffold434_cov186-Pinguiococcus_pyrenoidosus.AAC.99
MRETLRSRRAQRGRRRELPSGRRRGASHGRCLLASDGSLGKIFHVAFHCSDGVEKLDGSTSV